MLASLAHVVARHRWKIIVGWALLTAFGAFAAGQGSSRWYQSFSIPGKSAYETSQRTLKIFGVGVRPPYTVVFHSDGDVTKDDAVRAAILRAQKTQPGSLVSSFFTTRNAMYVSKDGHTTFANIYPAGSPTFDTKIGTDKVVAAAAQGLPQSITV